MLISWKRTKINSDKVFTVKVEGKAQTLNSVSNTVMTLSSGFEFKTNNIHCPNTSSKKKNFYFIRNNS